MAPVLAELARLLDYPGPELGHSVATCVERLGPTRAAAAELVAAFGDAAARLGQPRLEELYTSTFDFAADNALYVGHHLFPDSRRRGALMVGLRRTYRAHGFAAEGELPDHLGVVLRFLGAHGDAADADELVREAVRPVVGRLAARLEQHASPWAGVLRAIAICLGPEGAKA